MSLHILKIAVAVVVIITETGKFGESAQSDLSLLRQENTRLIRELSDLQQNYSSFLTDEQKTGQADNIKGNVQDKIEHDDQMVANECLESAMRLLEESIHVYDNFVKEEISKAEDELCNLECTEGERDWTYEYIATKCDVAEHVDKKIIRPFAERANELRDNANAMITSLDKSLGKQFGVPIDPDPPSSQN